MITEIKPMEYFKEMVEAAIERQKVSAAEMTEFYLSSLLESFINSERLTGEPLATRYLEAAALEGERGAHLLKELGDISLFTSGFFSESLKKKIVDMDYYIGMGRVSYGRLAAVYGVNKRTTSLAPLFAELAEKFTAYVDVLAEVSERVSLTGSKDILRLYERWLHTKSRRTADILRELGIEPVTVGTGTRH